jgi:hypothetical protein
LAAEIPFSATEILNSEVESEVAGCFDPGVGPVPNFRKNGLARRTRTTEVLDADEFAEAISPPGAIPNTSAFIFLSDSGVRNSLFTEIDRPGEER